MKNCNFLQPDLDLDNFKKHPKHDNFKVIFWPDGSLFRGDVEGVLKNKFKTNLMAQTHRARLVVVR